MGNKIVEIFFSPIEFLLNKMFEPITSRFQDKMFVMDSPFISKDFIHKYDFIAFQSAKFLWLFIFISALMFVMSGGVSEKRRYLTFFTESLIALGLLLGNKAIVYMINYMLGAMGQGISADIMNKISTFFIGGLATAIVAALNPAFLLLGVILGFLFFLLFSGLDMLEIFASVLVLISPLLICTYPIKSLRSFCEMFYKTYISIHLAVIFQAAVFFVAMLGDRQLDIFSRITIGIGSIILCIIVAPLILLKAVGSASKGVD